jgi:hypothetical protein
MAFDGSGVQGTRRFEPALDYKNASGRRILSVAGWLFRVL